jgi:signal transduction histidine kinase
MPTNRVPGHTYPLNGSVLEAVVESQAPVRATADSIEDAIRQFPGLAGPYETGYRSWLGVPLFALGEIIGGLHIQRAKPTPFAVNEIDILQRVAMHIGATAGKHNLIRKSKAENSRRNALLGIGKILGRTNDIEQAVAETASVLDSILPVDRFVVSLWSEESQSMVDMARWGVEIPEWDRLRDKPFKTLSSDHFNLDNPVMIVPTRTILDADHTSQPGLAYAAGVGLKSMIVASLIEDQRRTGNISARSFQADAYTPEDAVFFQEVGSLFTQYVAARIAQQAESESFREREQALASRKVALAEVQFQRSRERIVDTISHELRTPLTVILARADILSRRLNGQDEKITTGIDAIQRSSVELKGLVNKLIDHANRPVSNENGTLLEVDLDILAQALSVEIEIKFDEHDVQLRLLASGSTTIQCDLAQTVVAISELIDNGIKYGPEESPVTIEISAIEQEVHIAVKDLGTELHPEQIAQLFQPFERGNMMGNNRSRGAGLGLTFAAAVAEKQNGALAFENDADGSSMFVLKVPVTN